MFIKRSPKNPILKPNKNHAWEGEAVFNGCPVKKGGKIFLLYRGLSLPHYHASIQGKARFSNIGIAESKNGEDFYNRRRFIFPEYPWEKFGCEDPRVTRFNNKYYIFYTALSLYPFQKEGIKVGLGISKNLEEIEEKHLVTPFNAKAMALFPERIGGKIKAILTVHTDKPPAEICIASFQKEKEIWSKEYWQKWYSNFHKYSLPLRRNSGDHIEVGAPPLKTKYGWLLIYSYIQNYFSPQRLFGIEAVLLDLKNPLKIIAETKSPLFTPEEYYERIGLVPNVVFPSGAIIVKKQIYLYYGAADTTCCLAFIDLDALFAKFFPKEEVPPKFIRAKENPIIVPIKKHSWEAKATFNPGAIYLKRKVHLLYRAMSEDNTSVLGYAQSKDGIHIDYRSPEPVYFPRKSFEKKLLPQQNSGCEDPRLTKIGEKIYMCYTAFDGKNPPRVALTWIKEKDFLTQKWNWAEPVLLSPPGIDDKNACIFPEKVKGKYMIIHRSGDDIDLSLSSSLDFHGKHWLEEYCWITPREGRWDNKKIGAAAPPIKTKKGWILFYHGVSKEDGFYRVGACLLDLKDPTQVIARTDNPLLEPEAPYEKEGEVSNVVFPCGALLLGREVFLYYGGGDRVVAVATISLKKLLSALQPL